MLNSTVTGVSANTNSNAGTTSNSGVGTQALGESNFLQLLTTQLQYQDPLQPMDDTAFVAELAQFSQLEQLTNLNQTMTGMGNDLSTLNKNQEANLIGQNVIAQGGTIPLTGSSAPSLNYSLSGNASSVTVSITDASGNLVRKLQMGPQISGNQVASWDGNNNSGAAMPPGNYNFTVSAKDQTGAAVGSTTYTQGTVSGISFNNGTPYLIVNGTTVPASGLMQIN